MGTYTKSNEFISIVLEHDSNVKAILEAYPDRFSDESTIRQRIKSYRLKGLLPLASGNSVSVGEQLQGTSTLYDDDGKVKLQWVKTNVAAEAQLNSLNLAISELVKQIKPLDPTVPTPHQLDDHTLTMYVSNDIHFGALVWEPESGTDWDIGIATNTVRSAYDYLFSTSPGSKYGLVVDLGDLTESDDYKNMTPHSGNILAVDGRYPKILRAAYEALVYAIQKALQKHDIVYFINIAGNHDKSSGVAIREIVRAYFMNEPRVIVDDSPKPIKYMQHGNTLLQFAHGDGLKMKDAGEVMAHDCQDVFSSTIHRYAFFGHNHKDSVYDGRLCRSESFRNLAPTNDWAYHKGYRRQLGTMKSITFSDTKGEISRSNYNISIEDGQAKSDTHQFRNKGTLINEQSKQ